MVSSKRLLYILLPCLLLLAGHVLGAPVHQVGTAVSLSLEEDSQVITQDGRQKRNIFGAALNIANILGISPFNPPLLPSINLVGLNMDLN